MTIMAKKKTNGRARDKGETVSVTIELAVKLDDLVETVRQKERRTKRAFIERALEAYLRDKGHLPPEDESSSE